MKCPFCKQSLIVGESRRYQSGCEHGFNPNYIPEARNTYECTCNESSVYFWNHDGELYTIREKYDHDAYVENRKKYGEMNALNSIAEEVEKMGMKRERRRKLKKLLYFWK